MMIIIKITSWLLIILGALLLGFISPVLYMLLTGQVTPGEPYYVDDLAPTINDAIQTFSIGLTFIFVGFIAKYFAKRHTLNNTCNTDSFWCCLKNSKTKNRRFTLRYSN